MHGLVLGIHILLCLLILLVVLIQGGENVDITAAFGGVSQAAFGPRGTVSTLAKITWVLAAFFIATSIALSVWTSKSTGANSVLGHRAKQPAPVHTPARPAHPAPAPPSSNPFQP